MKFVAFAALIASASAADAAKVCAADPVTAVGYDETDATCATETADATKKTKNAALITALNTAMKPYLDKCAAAPSGTTTTPASTHMKVTCTDTKLTVGYFSDDKCATAVTVTAAPYNDITKDTCTFKAWDGVATIASVNADGSPSMKLGLKATVAAPAGDATNAKAMGAAVAATTLAVAATLY
jgi:hypothetical protein